MIMMVEVIMMMMVEVIMMINVEVIYCYIANAKARPCKQSSPRWWRTCWGRAAASPSSTAVAILLPLLVPSRTRLSSSLLS